MATNRMLRTLLHLKNIGDASNIVHPLNNVYKYFTINIHKYLVKVSVRERKKEEMKPLETTHTK